MNWEAVGAIGELLGGLVVIFSLVYVGVQIRQSTALARATAQRDLYESYQKYLYKVAEHSDLFRRAIHDFSSLSKPEQIEFNMYISPFVNHLDQTLRMYKAGFETADNVQVYGDICMSILSTRGGRAWWEMSKGNFVREGQKYIEDRFQDPSTLPPPLQDTMPFFGMDDA